MRYFFDFRDHGHLVLDDTGLDLPSLEAAMVEASAGLAGYAKDEIRGSQQRTICVEARTEEGPVFTTKMIFETNSCAA